MQVSTRAIYNQEASHVYHDRTKSKTDIYICQKPNWEKQTWVNEGENWVVDIVEGLDFPPRIPLCSDSSSSRSTTTFSTRHTHLQSWRFLS